MHATLRPVSMSLAVALASGLFGTAEAQTATGRFERTLDVPAPLELDVATGSGSIRIEAGSSGRAEIIGEVRARSTRSRDAAETEALVARLTDEPPIELVNGRLIVGERDHGDWRENVSISYQIRVPPGTPVRSRTGSGDQSLSGLEAGVSAATGSGSMTLDRVADRVEARTGSGSIRLVQSGPGDVEVVTGSGDAELRGIAGQLQARTGSGDIAVDGEQRGAWSLQTGSGDIVVRLPADSAFDVDAHTGSGDIRTSHPLTIAGRVNRNSVQGTVRGGGAPLRARTGSGDIAIE